MSLKRHHIKTEEDSSVEGQKQQRGQDALKRPRNEFTTLFTPYKQESSPETNDENEEDNLGDEEEMRAVIRRGSGPYFDHNDHHNPQQQQQQFSPPSYSTTSTSRLRGSFSSQSSSPESSSPPPPNFDYPPSSFYNIPNTGFDYSDKIRLYSSNESPTQIHSNNDMEPFSYTFGDPQFNPPNPRPTHVKSEEPSAIQAVSFHPSQFNSFSASYSASARTPVSSNSNNTYSSSAMSMMSKMGYKLGQGLGRDNQGISQPIQAEVQIDKKGLGYDQGALKTDIYASFEREEICWDRKVDWIPGYEKELPDDQCLIDWMEFGERKLEIEDETTFCEAELLSTMLQLKTEFDNSEKMKLQKARSRANPYELLRGAIFQNRAALKMADMDYATDLMFSDPKNLSDGQPLLKGDTADLLYFCDICAGPGGFTEYLTWRRGWKCKAWGLTLKDPVDASDFKLDKFMAGSTESFEPYYGVGGAEGDGDILKMTNIEEFARHVMKYSKPFGGVHVVMADGGFSVEKQENIQEILSKHLILCELLCALCVLGKNGHFVCKLFDCFTHFTVSLIYVAYMCFHSVAIYKPITSRPANSERYLICRGFKGQKECTKVIEHLKTMSEGIHNLKREESSLGDESPQDLLSIVPLDSMDESFVHYITNSNNEILMEQIDALKKVIQFIKNPNLIEERQAEVRDHYLEKWKIPKEARKNKPKQEAPKKFQSLCRGHVAPLSGEDNSTRLTNENLKDLIPSVHEYRFYFIGSALVRELLMSQGGIYIHRSSDLVKWTRLEQPYLVELPKDTVIQVEVLQEYQGENLRSSSDRVLHITDAFMIGGEDISNKPLKDRLHYAQQLTDAVFKPTQPFCRMRVKELIRLENLEEKLDSLERRQMRIPSPRIELCVILPDGKYYQCHGIRILRILKNSYSMIISKSTNKFYFFDKRSGHSAFDCPQSALASFWDCFQNSSKWCKEPGVQFSPEEEHKTPDRLSRVQILNLIHSLKNNLKASPVKM